MLNNRLVEKRVTSKNGKSSVYIAVVIDYRDTAGKRCQHYHNTKITLAEYQRGRKKEVEQIRRDVVGAFEKELATRQGRGIDYENITVMQALQKYAESIKTSKKISELVYNTYTTHYPNRMREYLRMKGNENLRLEKFTENDAEAFCDYLRSIKTRNGEPVSDNTIKHQLSFFKPAFRFSYDKKFVNFNAFARVKCPVVHLKKPQFFSKTEADTIWNALENEPLAVPIKVAIWTGLRRSELVGLKWSTVDFEANQIKVDGKILVECGKQLKYYEKLKTDSSRRIVPLGLMARSILEAHKRRVEANKTALLYNHEYDDFVFVDNRGNLIKPDRLTTTVKRICDKHGIKGGHLHELRHTYASHLRKSGADMKIIQELLGHSTFNTTANYYIGIDDDDKHAAVEKLAECLTFDEKKRKV